MSSLGYVYSGQITIALKDKATIKTQHRVRKTEEH